jgi:putative membrane protein
MENIQLNYMFELGFFGTRAPFFMDFVTLIVALLPFLVFGAIALTRKKQYNLHVLAQKIIFIVSVVVVGYFEYGVRLGGGFASFVEGSGVSYAYAMYVLLFHVAIAVSALVIWTYTLFKAQSTYKAATLPGESSHSHKKWGMLTFVGIILTSVTGIWVYCILFIY